jgi:hypothetical protein
VTALTDSVHFEIADLAAAVRLTRRLAPNWTVSLHERRDINLVSAKLRAASGDLAVLLRDVEAWVEEESLCAIRGRHPRVCPPGRRSGLAKRATGALGMRAEIAIRRARLLAALQVVETAIRAAEHRCASAASARSSGLDRLRQDISRALELLDNRPERVMSPGSPRAQSGRCVAPESAGR